MEAGKFGGTGWHYNWLFKTYNQIPPPRTCVFKHLGITILLHCLRHSLLAASAPFYLPVFIPCRLAPLLHKRHSVPPSIHQGAVAPPEDITDNLSNKEENKVKLSITTLSENTAAAPDLLAEWGLSILVETDTVNILLDTGQRISTSHNADILGIDLSKVDKVVLSHGHFDHTGGLRQVLRQMRKEVEIIAHPDIWAAKYTRRQGQAERFLGVPFQRQELENLGARFNLTTKPVKITDNIMTTGEVPMVTEFEEIEPHRFFVKEDTDFKPDKLLDDQALIINTEQGLIVILGCAHHGIINTLYHAQQLTGAKQIHMVLGGCHLIGANEERIRLTIAALRELGMPRIGVSHCTKLPAAAIMAQEFGNSFFFNNAGTRTNLP